MSERPEPTYSRYDYLLFQTLRRGVGIFLAKEAVATTMLEHPEWDRDEMKTFREWDAASRASR